MITWVMYEHVSESEFLTHTACTIHQDISLLLLPTSVQFLFIKQEMEQVHCEEPVFGALSLHVLMLLFSEGK